MNKYGVFFHEEFVSRWMPVKTIFNIEKVNDADNVIAKKVNGIQAFEIIGGNTYRNHYVDFMKLNTLHFKISSALVKQCDVYKISRPANRDSVSEVVEIIEKELE